MSWLVKAKDSISAKKYDEALEFLTRALKDNPKSHKAYLERSIVYQRIGAYPASLDSSEHAIAWANINGNREILGEAQLRRAVALISLNRPIDALHSLELAIKYGCNDKSLSIWRAKIEKAAETAENKTISIIDIPKVSLTEEIDENEEESSEKAGDANEKAGDANEKSPKPTNPALIPPKKQMAFERNWDKVALDLDDETEKASNEKDADPMDFFRAIYDKADPDTQRAMMKSYIESNGTTLSTNWEDVKKGRVETSPPDGMDSKKW